MDAAALPRGHAHDRGMQPPFAFFFLSRDGSRVH